MTLDPEALKNDLVEGVHPPEFENQMLEASDTLIADGEPAMHYFLSLEPTSVKNTAVNKCQLQFGNEGKGLSYSEISKHLHDK